MVQREKVIKKQWVDLEARISQKEHISFTRLLPLIIVDTQEALKLLVEKIRSLDPNL